MSDQGDVSLVGPTLLVVMPGTAASSVQLATASLLVASTAAASSSQWGPGLIGSLATMGWTTTNTGTDSRTAPAPTFTPWSVALDMASADLAPDEASALDHAVSALSGAGPQAAARWRTATTVGVDHYRATLAITAQTGGDPRLVVVIVDLTYAQTPAVTSSFPWGQWPSAGATLGETRTKLAIDAATAATLLAALTPKVAGVLATDVITICP